MSARGDKRVPRSNRSASLGMFPSPKLKRKSPSSDNLPQSTNQPTNNIYRRRQSVPDLRFRPPSGGVHGGQLEKEKLELKTKVSELEEYQTKYEDQKRENELLQRRLSDLTVGQSDATQNLLKAREAVDRLTLDQKKKIELIEKLQADVRFRDDRIRNLEIRASEVEKAELILETTKQNLESQIQSVRIRDGQIKKLDNEIEDKQRQIEHANQTIDEQTEKMEDLKLQVRHELMKNDNIEKNLETIPRLKDTIEEKEGEIKTLQHQLQEKTTLLVSARRAVREYKDQQRATERDISEMELLRKELSHSQSEVITLKKLMYGKDYLVTQKSKALDLSKEIIEVLNDHNNNHHHVQKIQHMIDRIGSVTDPPSPNSTSTSRHNSVSCSVNSLSSGPLPRQRSTTPGPAGHRDISVDNYPYSIEHDNHTQGNTNGNRFLNRVITDTPVKRRRPNSAMATPTYLSKSSGSKTSTIKEAARVYTAPLPRRPINCEIEIVHVTNNRHVSHKSDRHASSNQKPSFDYVDGTDPHTDECDSTPRGQTSSRSTAEDTDSVFTNESDLERDLTPDQEVLLQGLSGKDKDRVLLELITTGDRILITRPQKPPKYGKKRVLKPINYTGIVKYVGKFDTEKYDARVRVGVRLDESAGDTDGTYKGKRYMYTPSDLGKFFKLREVNSVLNVKTGHYCPVKTLMYYYVLRCRQQNHNGSSGE